MSHVPALLVATLLVALCAGREEVDLVLTGGKVAIVDEAFGIHETIVIDDARVLAVGDAGLADRYDAARRVELDGRLIVPGFNDTHTHINGRPRRHIDLAGTESIAEIQRDGRGRVDHRIRVERGRAGREARTEAEAHALGRCAPARSSCRPTSWTDGAGIPAAWTPWSGSAWTTHRRGSLWRSIGAKGEPCCAPPPTHARSRASRRSAT